MSSGSSSGMATGPASTMRSAFYDMQMALLCRRKFSARTEHGVLPPNLMRLVNAYAQPGYLLILPRFEYARTTERPERTETLRLDIDTLTWTRMLELAYPLDVSGVTLTRLNDGNILAVGGDRSAPLKDMEDRCYIYDPKITGEFSETGRMNSPCIVQTLVTLPYDGRVMAICTKSDKDRNIVDFYSPDTGTWTLGTTRPKHPRSHTVAVALSDGHRVLIMGGYLFADLYPGETKTCEIYDCITNTFVPAADMLWSRQRHAACLLPNGKVFVAGGSISSDIPEDCEEYDPDTNTWTAAPSLPRRVIGHACVFLEARNSVFLFGSVISMDSHRCFLFSLETRTWTRVTNNQRLYGFHGYAIYKPPIPYQPV